MPRYEQVIRSTPHRVWQVLHDVGFRTAYKGLADEVTASGAGAHFVRKGVKWTERVVEAEDPWRLVLERAEEGAEAPDRLEWRLQALNRGTLTVLEVKPASVGRRFALMWTGRRYRRLVEAVKAESEKRGVLLPPAQRAAERQPETPSEPRVAPARPAGKKSPARHPTPKKR